jgi:hypothetical protein
MTLDAWRGAQDAAEPGLSGMTVIPETTNHQHSLSRNWLALVALHGNIDSTKAVHTSGFLGP